MITNCFIFAGNRALKYPDWKHSLRHESKHIMAPPPGHHTDSSILAPKGRTGHRKPEVGIVLNSL